MRPVNEKPAGIQIPPCRYWWGAFLALSLSVLGFFLIGGADLKQSACTLRAFKTGYLAATAGLVILLWAFEALRMKAILLLLEEKLPVKDIVPVNLAFSFAAGVTPAASGGPPAHAYLFYLRGIKGEKAFAAVSARTLFAVGSISFLNPVIAFSFRNYLGLPPVVEKLVLIGVGMVATGIFLFLFFSLRPQSISFLLKWFPARIRENFTRRLAEFSAFFRSLLFSPRKNILIFILLLSFLYWAVFFTIGWVLARALDSSLTWPIMVARQMVLHFLLGYVPLPGASGVAEVGYAAFFASAVPDTALLTLVAGWRFFTYYLNIFLGGIFFWWLVVHRKVNS